MVCNIVVGQYPALFHFRNRYASLLSLNPYAFLIVMTVEEFLAQPAWSYHFFDIVSVLTQSII